MPHDDEAMPAPGPEDTAEEMPEGLWASAMLRWLGVQDAPVQEAMEEMTAPVPSLQADPDWWLGG